MKILFEEWMHEQNFNETVIRLFEESLLCYKAKAYRAALLFSFTAFQKILKFRLINASTPKVYENKPLDWDKIVKELMNEDRVDHKIIQCVNQNKEGNQIFFISEDLRSQYTYWKDRRNDCAHGKSNIIDINHVEAFWLFLKSSLPKFQVNGGKEALFNKIKDYLNDDITPINAKPTNIINDISNMVTLEECKEFYNELIEEFKASPFWDFAEMLEEKQVKILMGILGLSKDYRVLLVEVLEQNPIMFVELLYKDITVLQFIKNPAFIRCLWRKNLSGNSEHSYKIIIGLLKYDLVPKDEKKELYDFCLTKFKDQYFINATELDYQVLNELGFVKFFEEKAFNERKINDFSWSERNKNLVAFYLKYTKKVNKQVILSLDHAFLNSNYPYKLKDALRNLFIRDSNVYEKIIVSFEAEDLEMPEHLKID